ncbi:Patatin-like phospholipase/acyl hydrolase [Planctomycetales bacterium 10988]|nr:Patatin-like phospholipase/acyl hydrolase [Planctomycetales bacterium 10988]
MAYRIIALDGGGIRGVMTAIWLSRLEQKLGGRLRDHIDLIAGTSTGSILACGVSVGIPADDIVDMYLTRGQEVFPTFSSRFWERVQRTFQEGLSAPRYDGLGLNRVLKSVFREETFGNLKIRPTIVVSYNAFEREAVLFKNTLDNFTHLPVWEVVRASSSAPAYFPAHIMKLAKERIPLIDGGVVANNPTACAIAEGIRHTRLFPPNGRPVVLEDIVVASFGTGQTTRRITVEEALEWGGVQWALPVLDVLFDGAGDAVDFTSKQLLAEDSYFRFQCRLDSKLDDLDNADPRNLKELVATAEDYLKHSGGEEKLQQLADLLKENPQPAVKEEKSISAPVPAFPSEAESIDLQQEQPKQEVEKQKPTETVASTKASNDSELPNLLKTIFKRRPKAPQTQLVAQDESVENGMPVAVPSKQNRQNFAA